MKLVVLIQFIVAVVGSLLVGYFCGAQQSYSFLIGAGLILLNFLLLGLAWKLIFAQKFVALSIGVIVFKYAILGIIIFKLVKNPWVSLLWFSMGVATFMIPAIAYAIKEALNKKEEM